ncbi:MAG: crotonase/enoyl-CoA hydratase family protein [Alphaproteobacteria bacterium]|nr:crotonase/enoyl-CoA hydratase family protein [Alphaproteobacteria bacterium]
MSSEPAVTVSRSGPVTTVTLSRPEVRNAVNLKTAEALAEAFLAFEADAEARVAVFHGANGTFCAGADLKAVAGGDGGNPIVPPATGLAFSRLAADGPMGPSRMVLSKPVIAAVAGHAVAGGMELALWCDLRIMEEDAIFGIFCRRWGVPLIDGGTVRLPRIVGHGRALDLILTGRPVGAEEALAMGLANRIAKKGEGLAAAQALAMEIAKFPSICLQSDRMSAYEQWDMPYDQAIANEFRRGVEVLRSGETQAGAKRFAGGAGRSGRFDDL